MEHPVGQTEAEHPSQRIRRLPLPPVLQAGDQITQPPIVAAKSDHPIQHTAPPPACTAAGSVVPPIAPRPATGTPGKHTLCQHRLIPHRLPRPPDPSSQFIVDLPHRPIISCCLDTPAGIDLLAAPKEHDSVAHTLDTWRWIVGDDAVPLLEAGAAIDPSDVTAISRLRKQWTLEQVAVAMELLDARRRAARKFPKQPPIACDRPGIEQATPEQVAVHKAERIRSMIGRGARMHDLACGIGGDAMALARHFEVIGVDIDPIRCWMTRCNAECDTIQTDVTSMQNDGDWFHLDPGRRDPLSGRRLPDPADWLPPLSCLDELAARHRGGVVKLGPGIALDVVPAPESRELEFVSLEGRLSQAHLWLGDLVHTPGHHRAVMLPTGLEETGTPILPELGAEGEIRSVLCVPDPALERSMLHGNVGTRFDLVEPAPGLGLLTGDAVPDTAWFTSFHVDEVLPWRIERVQEWLRRHDTGAVEIKTRDRTVDPDRIQSRLAGTGSVPRTVFVLRLGRPVVAIITRRANNPCDETGSNPCGDGDQASR